MQKQTISTITLLFAALVLSIGISYVSASFVDNTNTPPAYNLEVPVNAGTVLQAKQEGLSVNTFAALGNASLERQAFFRGPIKGIESGSLDPTLRIGGMSTTGSKRVTTTANGNISSGKTIGSSELINSNLNPLCSDDQGHVVFCGSVVVTPPVPSGTIELDNISTYVQPIANITINPGAQHMQATNDSSSYLQVPVGTYTFTPSCSLPPSSTASTSLLGSTPSPATVTVTNGGVSVITVNCKCTGNMGICTL